MFKSGRSRLLMGLLQRGCFYPCGNPVCFLSANPRVTIDVFRLGGDYTGVAGAGEELVGGSR